MRIANLDSLRGLAAFIVVLNHLYNNVPSFAPPPPLWIIEYTPLYHLIDGRQAVLLFFVLSGFVLTLPFIDTSKNYVAYALRRICRIYIPYAVMLTLAAALYYFIATRNLGAEVISSDWKSVNMPQNLLHYYLMTGLKRSTELNPPGWSLIFELRISLLLPLLIVMIARFKLLGVGFAFLFSFAAAKLFHHYDDSESFYTSTTALGTLLLTIYYIQFFAFGIFCALHRHRLSDIMNRIPKMAHLCIGAVIFMLPHALIMKQFTLAQLYYASVSVYLILCCISFKRVDRILELQVFR